MNIICAENDDETDHSRYDEDTHKLKMYVAFFRGGINMIEIRLFLHGQLCSIMIHLWVRPLFVILPRVFNTKKVTNGHFLKLKIVQNKDLKNSWLSNKNICVKIYYVWKCKNRNKWYTTQFNKFVLCLNYEILKIEQFGKAFSSMQTK